MTQSPLERYQQQLQMKQQKKSDNSGLYVLVGSAVALIVVVGVVMKMRSSPEDTPTVIETVAPQPVYVDVGEAKRREVYADYAFVLDASHDHRHSCKQAADLNRLSIGQVEQIVNEGKMKGWPTSSGN